MKSNRLILHLLSSLVLLTACRGDDFLIVSDDTDLGVTSNEKSIVGMYVLNQGNMGSNKCTLDYLDLSAANSTIHYYENIFAERNPSEVKELGDVGNDMKTYGSKLWIVVNCSNKIEVCRASDTKKVGKIDIPNCRYLAFHDDCAYISSYVGPVAVGGDAPLGRVYKVDTLSLQKIDSLTVGYQPDEIAVVGDRLYVANSGGYRLPEYDNRLSVIDLNTFQTIEQIEVAPNLHRCRADRYGQLWLATHGSNSMNIVGDTLFIAADEKTELFCLNPRSRSLVKIPSASFTGSRIALIDVFSHQPIPTAIFNAPEIQQIEKLYSLKVNPDNRDFYLMDAKNYVSSGELLHFKADGSFDWRVWTGDIPCAAAFVGEASVITPSQGGNSGEEDHPLFVDEYLPAPGQFVNQMPKATADDTPETIARKCEEQLRRGGLVSLGAFGGYITFHFDKPVQNIPGEYDFIINGNAIAGGSEPGIVMVSQDTNGNGLPDDEWFELAGSADTDSISKVRYNYQKTYRRADYPSASGSAVQGVPVFPLWIKDDALTFCGTRLPNNGFDQSANGSYWHLSALRYGYVDNLPNSNTDGNSFNIEWAVDSNRQPVSLTHIDFIRVYSALDQTCGWLGETSTEISGARPVRKTE